MNSIEQIRTTDPAVVAFEVRGEIQSEDLDRMAKTMNAAFDHHDSVRMLMVFRPYEGAETGATLDWDVFESNVRSLTNLEKYAVVGVADGPKGMIDFMDKLIPVDAETFEPHELDAAWAFVGARPAQSVAR